MILFLLLSQAVLLSGQGVIEATLTSGRHVESLHYSKSGDVVRVEDAGESKVPRPVNLLELKFGARSN